MRNQKIVVVGSVNADHVMQVPRFPQAGETLMGHSYALHAGGKGANQAVAAARMGGDVALVAMIGDDAVGEQMRNGLRADQIDVAAVMVQPQAATGVAMIQVAASGENQICLDSGANAALTPTALAPHQHCISQAAWLLMQLEIPIDSLIYAAQLAKQAQTKVVLNPAPAQALPPELLQAVDVITPNESEAEQLTGIKVDDGASAHLAAQCLHQQGVATVIITLGQQGAWLSQQGVGELIAGYRVTAVDTTAAGDTFNGALLVGLQQTGSSDYRQAIRFAHAAAALSVTRHGAQPAIPSRAEVDEFLACG